MSQNGVYVSPLATSRGLVAAAGTAFAQIAFKSALSPELDFSKMVHTVLKAAPDEVHIPELVYVAQSLVVMLLKRCRVPKPDQNPDDIARRLSTAGVLIHLIERVEDAMLDFGIGRKSQTPSYAATLRGLEGKWDTDPNLRGGGRSPMLANVMKRFAENVQTLQQITYDQVEVEKHWPLDGCHDYQGVRYFYELADVAMDAALRLECNFDDRVFGPETPDAG